MARMARTPIKMTRTPIMLGEPIDGCPGIRLVPDGKNREDYPVCIYPTVRYQPYTEAGFPSSEDHDAFEIIEGELSSICNGEHTTFIGTVFISELKDFIIYTSAPDKLSDLLEPKVTKYGQFEFEFGGHEDPVWSQYESFA